MRKKLGVSNAYFYATPEYVDKHGPFDVPEDLLRASIMAFDRSDVMIKGLRAFGVEVTAAQFPIIASNHLVQWALCKQGAGMCIMMDVVGDPEPTVVKVLSELSIPFPMWLVSHRELKTSRRIRLVYDFLARELG